MFVSNPLSAFSWGIQSNRLGWSFPHAAYMAVAAGSPSAEGQSWIEYWIYKNGISRLSLRFQEQIGKLRITRKNGLFICTPSKRTLAVKSSSTNSAIHYRISQSYIPAIELMIYTNLLFTNCIPSPIPVCLLYYTHIECTQTRNPVRHVRRYGHPAEGHRRIVPSYLYHHVCHHHYLICPIEY